jgi:hypothetical protein
MNRARNYALLSAIAFALFAACNAWAADYTQQERDTEFIKSSRRQNATLKTYYGDMVPTEVTFNFVGSYKVVVHRDGLERPITLIPVKNVRFPDMESLRESARKNQLVVGALSITYAHQNPFINPGTHLLLYDGLNIEIRNVHGYEIAAVQASVSSPTADAEVDPVLGTIPEVSHSLANITETGNLELYLQLADDAGQPIAEEQEFLKVLISVPLPGITDDDDSPARILVQPKEEED